MRWTLIILTLMLTPVCAIAQPLPVDPQTELAYRMRVKQVSQFIQRFNNEDPDFHRLHDQLKGGIPSQAETVKYMTLPTLDAGLVRRFLDDVANQAPKWSYGQEGWYALAKCLVSFQGSTDTLNLSLRISPDVDQSYKWVISGAQADFLELEPPREQRFINPVSHETHFIDLYAVMKDRGNARAYIDPEFEGDDLTLLAQAINRGVLSYSGVFDLTFFFLQMDGWIVGIEDRNDLGAAGGWLIGYLEEADSAGKQAFKRQRLYLDRHQ